MKQTPVIALLTDFGLSDHYAGTMKAVILSHNPSARIVDISHGVHPQQIQQGAYLLWSSYKFFPKGTVFVCVVDPGVGSERDTLIVQTRLYTFIAPDNGLLNFVLADEQKYRAYRVNRSNPKLFGSSVSRTFHGRDVFAPMAAALSAGKKPEKLGTKVALPPIVPEFVKGSADVIKPVILHVDRFGNLITNIAAGARGEKRGFSIGVSGRGIFATWITHYAEAPERIPCLTIGSSGLVEIVVKNDSAAKSLNVGVGSSIKVYWQESQSQ